MKYLFATAVLFLVSSPVFCQDVEVLEYVKREMPAIEPPSLGSKESPFVLDRDKAIMINEESYILDSIQMDKAFTLMESLPSVLKKWSVTGFDLYTIDGKTITENYFVLKASIYRFDKGAEVRCKDKQIEVISDNRIFQQYSFVYIKLNDGGYKTICFADSPAYLSDGTHMDAIGDFPITNNRELAKDVLYQYMKANQILCIKSPMIKPSRKGMKRIKNILGH